MHHLRKMLDTFLRLCDIDSDIHDLEGDIDQYGDEGIGQIENQPDFYWFYIRGGRQAGGHRQVDGGEDHHAGDVDGVDHVVLSVSLDVVGGLVDHVHEDSGQVGHHEDALNLPRQDHGDPSEVTPGPLIKVLVDGPAINHILPHHCGPHVPHHLCPDCRHVVCHSQH